MLHRVLRLLVCPACHGPLDRGYPPGKMGGRVRVAELSCRSCRGQYSVQEGVGLFASSDDRGMEWRPDPGLLAQPPDERLWQQYLASLPPEVPVAYQEAERAIVEGALGIDGPVVDLATCRGHVLRPLAARSGAHQMLIGTDPEVPRLYSTQALLRKERHYGNVSLLGMGGTRWPFRDAGVSGAISFYGPSILPSGRKILKEASRVLRPGAPFIFATLLTEPGTLTLRQAEARGLGELLTTARLRQALRRYGFLVDAWTVLAEGRAWQHGTYDPLPLPGDPWQQVLVQTHLKWEVRSRAPRRR